MQIKLKMLSLIMAFGLSNLASAADISGLWQSIDDKTGAPKGLVELKMDTQGVYTGTIKKITPRVGYTPKEFCVNCPAPYTGKPMIGLKAITGLKHINGMDMAKAKSLIPIQGKYTA